MSNAIIDASILVSVCKQELTFHRHYNIFLVSTPPVIGYGIGKLRVLVGRFTARTAGELVEGIQRQIALGADLSLFGVVYMEVEDLPLWQHCVKGRAGSLSLDWSTLL